MASESLTKSLVSFFFVPCQERLFDACLTVDSEMCTISTSLKLDLVNQFAIVLQGSVKPSVPSHCSNFFFPRGDLTLATVITQCSIVELYKLGPHEQQAVDMAKSFERRKCNHKEAIPGDECIASVVGRSLVSKAVTWAPQLDNPSSQAMPTSTAISLRVSLRR